MTKAVMTRGKINGLPIVNAKKKVTISIVSRDILRGDTRDPGACAAAQACKRQFHATAARVHLGRTYVQVGRKWLRYLTPHALRTEIVSFDRGANFSPGKYVLSPMPPSRFSGKQQGSPKNGRTGKKRAKYHVLTGLRMHGANR
jgi:hypothetical protein